MSLSLVPDIFFHSTLRVLYFKGSVQSLGGLADDLKASYNGPGKDFILDNFIPDFIFSDLKQEICLVQNMSQ